MTALRPHSHQRSEPRRRPARKGVVHVLEAVIAAMLLIFFVLTMAPSANDTIVQQQGEDRSHNVLAALAAADALQQPARDGNVTGIRELVQPHLSDRRVEIALQTLNSTQGTPVFDSTHNVTFHRSEHVERTVLHVWYRNASNPTVAVNGNTVDQYTERVTDEYRSYRVGDHTSTGQNHLNLTAGDRSRIGYRIDRYEERRSGSLPMTADVHATPYLLSNPVAEVTILSWR